MNELAIAAHGEDDADLLKGTLALIVSANASSLLHNRIATPAITFGLRAMPPGMSKHCFRFLPNDIIDTHANIPFPAVIYTQRHFLISSLEALWTLLARLAYPCR
ncbi:hypothetical protein PybrP1_008773 [[Pythium] brassicae (nom. inval.)]|nr:hypothetical protein PybrP1_008773 [[Pythium] brassicae (nom. inval.)]